MRKIIGIVTALFILTAFVGAASAWCPPGSDCAPSTYHPEIKPGYTGYGDVDYGGTTSGDSNYVSSCQGSSKTTTISGQYGWDSGFSQTTTSSSVDKGLTWGGTEGSSGYNKIVN